MLVSPLAVFPAGRRTRGTGCGIDRVGNLSRDLSDLARRDRSPRATPVDVDRAMGARTPWRSQLRVDAVEKWRGGSGDARPKSRECVVVAVALVARRDMWADRLVFNQPAEEPTRAVAISTDGSPITPRHQDCVPTSGHGNRSLKVYRDRSKAAPGARLHV